jgi:hypothetical protein
LNGFRRIIETKSIVLSMISVLSAARAWRGVSFVAEKAKFYSDWPGTALDTDTTAG